MEIELNQHNIFNHETLTRKRKVICAWGIYLIYFGMMLQAYADPIVWPAFGLQQGYGNTYAILLTVTSLFAGISTPIAAKCCTFLSKKHIYLTASVLYAIGCTAQAIPLPMAGVLFLRLLIGISIGFLFTSGFTLIGDIFPPEKRGFWIGAQGMVMGIASVISSPLAGILNDLFSVKIMFFLSLPFFIAGFILLIKFLPNITGTEKIRSFDFKGAIFLSLGLGSFILLATFGEQWVGTRNLMAIALFILMVLSLSFFINFERKTGKNGILPVSVVRSRNFLAITLSAFFSTASATFFYYCFSYYMLSYMNVTGLMTGITISLQFVITLFFGPAFGSFLAKKGYLYQITGFACLLMIAVYGWFALFVNMSTPLMQINIGMFLFGFYTLVITTSYTFAAQNYIDEQQRPYTIGSVQLAQSVGYCLTLAIITACLNRFSNNIEVGYDIVYIISIVLTILTFISTLAIRPKGATKQ
ncbi:MAG TPA: MFS transporter [Clostridiales bacterium]|nr:MFS transporter [Clostridiales bacterium]